MARRSRVSASIGTLLALVVVAVSWFVVSDRDSEQSGEPGTDAIPASTPHDAPGGEKTIAARRWAARQSGAAIVGHVRRTDDQTPVTGQPVLVRGDGGLQIDAFTDHAGEFRLEGIPAGGPYELVVAATGFVTVRLPGIALDRNEQRDVGALLLDAAVTVEVHVRSLTDVPIEGAQVLAFAVSEPDSRLDRRRAREQIGQDPVPVARVTTDASGAAMFVGLGAGSWTFLARKDGYASSVRSGRRLHAGDAVAPITLYLGSGHELAGRVLDGAGAPISGALVLAAEGDSAWRVSASPLLARAMTAADGSYRLEGLSPGETTIMAAPPNAAPKQIDRIRIPDVANFDIVLHVGGTVTGVVTMHDSGAPIEGALVRASVNKRFGPHSAEAMTDADGRYTIEGLPEGDVSRVHATKDAFVQFTRASLRVRHTLRDGAIVERDIEMTRGAALEGTITGPDGPVAGAHVTIAHEGTPGFFGTKATRADAQGKYRVDDLRAGRVLVEATADGLFTADLSSGWWKALLNGAAPASLSGTVETGETTVIDVRLSRGQSLSGRVELQDGTPVEGARIVARFTANLATETRGRFAFSAKDGTYTVTGLPAPTTVTVLAENEGLGALPRDAVPVTLDGPSTDVTIVMQAWPVVRGHVTAKDGELPGDASVSIVAIPDTADGRRIGLIHVAQHSARFPVHPDGSFEAPVPLLKGSFVVRAHGSGRPDSDSADVMLEEDRSEYETDVELGEGHDLSGSVTDAQSGAGIGGARVRVTTATRGNRRIRGIAMIDGKLVAAPPLAVTAVTDAHGRFTIRGLPNGEQEIRVRIAGYLDGSIAVEMPRSSALALRLERELKISGVLVYSDGTPVPGVNVVAKRADARSSSTRSGRGSGSAGYSATDAEGRFDIGKLEHGLYVLSAGNSFTKRTNLLPLASAPTRAGSSDVRLVAQRGGSISGSIRGADGEPVAQASINARPQDKSRGGRTAHTLSGPDGSFDLVALAPDSGAYTLHISVSSVVGRSLTPVTMTDVQLGTRGLEVVLFAGLSIEGTVAAADGGRVRRALVAAHPIAREGGAGGGVGFSPVGPAGEFKVLGLKPGRYRLTMSVSGTGGKKQIALEGGADVVAGATGLRLKTTAGTSIPRTSIGGVVVNGAGRPVSGVVVQGTPEGGGLSRSAITDEHGAFELTGLETATSYTLRASAAERRGSEKEGIVAGASGVRLTIHDE